MPDEAHDRRNIAELTGAFNCPKKDQTRINSACLISSNFHDNDTLYYRIHR